MSTKQWLTEKDLAALAKRFRTKAGKTRAEAARDMDVSQTSIFNAEETPSQSLLKLRTRMVEVYSSYQVVSRILLVRKRKIKD